MDEILHNIQNIAVVGLSPDESKASNMVAKFLIKKGFKIFPIYPKEDKILGQKVYRNLSDINENIDIIVMFRKGEYADILIDEVIRKGVKTLWLQLGITNENAKARAYANGIKFIQNKCIKIELERLENGIFK
ncbi:CoA-binding protein [Campylobacter sp. RM13119]|uniref:CoA-binding protein n=1 Tax=Campylobacter TaxID=194 RepID=UPI001475AE57|nr:MULTISPECIES: CoA-binding protein [unclassified Campylobacter]MBE3022898.1 CoA-binding protein [Campylobacter sp. 7477a]MBE3606979.1 CoA-binding protein [Campylobacter sp. RM13119]MBE3610550.1 CoA-binding protein [Campylobacter sp. RM12916]